MVEMAGVEPASERIDPRIYYERVPFLNFARHEGSEQNLMAAIHLDPRALFCSAS